MAEYKEYIYGLRKCAEEHKTDSVYTGKTRVTDLCNDTADLLEKLETDVVERSKIDKAIEESYKMRDEVLRSNDTYTPNDVLQIIDDMTKLFEEI